MVGGLKSHVSAFKIRIPRKLVQHREFKEPILVPEKDQLLFFPEGNMLFA